MKKAKDKQSNTEKAFTNINLRSFISVACLLIAVLAVSGLITLFIPQGSFQSMKEDGSPIVESYVKGEIKGIAFWRVLTAPFRVFASEDALTIIMISVFLLVMSGVFNLIEKTGGIRITLSKIITRFNGKKKAVVFVCVFVFMLFGSFFGMFEELVTLLPLVIALMLSMGMDTITGLCVCMVGACFGFSSAITNPFSVGLASSVAGVGITEGIWLRIVFFVLVLVALCACIYLHIRKIAKNPQLSPTYEIDEEKRKTLNLSFEMDSEKEKRVFKVYTVFFSVQIVLLILLASIRAISGYAIPVLAVSFLVGGIVCGLLVCEKKSDTFVHMGKGALGMLPAVVLIAIASSVKLVLSESGILDTVMYFVINLLDGKSKFLCVILIYLLTLFLQLFIGSASAKIMLVMPILMPICTALGLSPSLVILTYCMADGFTDVIIPTNPVLLIGLSMAGVSYGKWLKSSWLIQVVLLALSVLTLLFAVGIGY